MIVVFPDHTHLFFAILMLLLFFCFVWSVFYHAVLSVMYFFEEERDKLLYFNRLLDVLYLLVFCNFASWCT